MTLNIDEENIDFLKEALATRRLQAVNKLRVMDVNESMLVEIREHSAQPSCPMKVNFSSSQSPFLWDPSTMCLELSAARMNAYLESSF